MKLLGNFITKRLLEKAFTKTVMAIGMCELDALAALAL